MGTWTISIFHAPTAAGGGDLRFKEAEGGMRVKSMRLVRDAPL
jgi:hypothetical protein